jgi:hypothetical protein
MSPVVFLIALPWLAYGQQPIAVENPRGPAVLHWNVEEELPTEIAAVIADLRSQADAFIFLSGGASNMAKRDLDALLDLFRSFETLSARGLRFAVGDGGTKAGIMEAAGRARAASGQAFPLLGVAPAPEVGADGRSGSTEIETNHSHILTVTNEPWLEAQKEKGWKPSWGYWGSETEAMYEIFDRLSAGRASAAIVANGGAKTLDEVELNLRQGRRILLISGSGRVADGLVAALEAASTDFRDIDGFRERISSLQVGKRRDSFRVFPLAAGPEALADLLMRELGAR